MLLDEIHIHQRFILAPVWTIVSLEEATMVASSPIQTRYHIEDTVASEGNVSSKAANCISKDFPTINCSIIYPIKYANMQFFYPPIHGEVVVLLDITTFNIWTTITKQTPHQADATDSMGFLLSMERQLEPAEPLRQPSS